jgi:hypothetical protein
MRGTRIVGALVALVVTGCGLLTNLDDLSGGGTDAADSGGSDAPTSDVEPDIAPPKTCNSATTACVPAAPSGWIGPFELFTGSPTSAPSCASPLVPVLGAHDGVANANAACSPCGCGVTGVSCATPSVDFFSSFGCSGLCFTDSTPTSCKQLPVSQCAGAPYVKANAPNAIAACASDGGVPADAAPTFTTAAVGCKEPGSALVQVDCASGEVCAPKSTAPFDPSLCVLQQGDVACDGPPYATKHVFYSQFTDGRGCTSCACSSSSGVKCDGGGLSMDTNQCSALVGAFGACVSSSGDVNYEVSATPPPTSAVSCVASGGSPTGTVTESQPVTVCCL